jgi:tetratricopeptide (TPR) repeat protein
MKSDQVIIKSRLKTTRRVSSLIVFQMGIFRAGVGARFRRGASSTIATIAMILLMVVILSTFGCSRGELLEQAQQAWDNGDYAAAAGHYETFLREKPQSDEAASVRFRVATVCSRDLKQYDRAIEHFIRLIEDHPKSPDIPAARLRLAECYAAVGKRDEAISEYESLLPSLTDDKERRRLRLNIAELYYEKNDLRQAVVEYRKVVENTGYDELAERAYLRIGQVHYLRDNFDDAVPAYQAVIDNTRDPLVKRVAQSGKVDCYERVLQFDLAIKTLEEMVPDSKSPDSNAKRIADLREQQRQRSLVPSAKLDWAKR